MILCWPIVAIIIASIAQAKGQQREINILVLLPMKSPTTGYVFPFGMELCGGAGKKTFLC